MATPRTGRAAWRELPWYPILFAATYVLNLWVESGVSVMAVTRSLAVVIVGTMVILVVLALLTRRPHVAGAAALLVFALLISRGPGSVAAVLILALAVPLAMVLWGRIRRTPLSWARFTRTLDLFSVLLVLVVLIGGVARGTYAALVFDVVGERGAAQHAALDAASQPDFLILILDGYPGDASYARLIGGDNQPFTKELEARGFEVLSDPGSNYSFTQGTLTSMLHMRPLHEIDELAPLMAGEEEAYPLMRVVLNRNPAFDLLRGRGYRVVTSSSGYEHVTLRGADEFLDDGSLNEVERHLIRFTTLHRIIDLVAPDALANQHRERILAGFDFYRQAAGEAATAPVFAIVHVPSPHPPVVLDRDGGLLASPPPEEAFNVLPLADEGRVAYADQLIFLNEEVLRALDDTDESIAPGQEPIVIVMSDHGAAPQTEVAAGRIGDDHFANFVAIRTPDDDGPSFGDETTPVNLLSTLFNAYLGTDYPMWPDQRFPAEWFGGPAGSFH